MNKLSIGACVLLAACSNADSLGPRAVQPTFVNRLSTPASKSGPPNVAEARAAEAAALSDIEANLSPESRAPILAALRDANQDGHIYLVKGTTDAWNKRYARFYDARAHRQDEERREASIAAARVRGAIPVVVALADPPNGAIAAVFRRPSGIPAEVIVLGPSATPETLGGALAALDQSRQLYGDDLTNDMMIGISDVHATSIDSTHLARLQELLNRLKDAPARLVEGVGTAKAIAVHSSKLPPAKP